MELFMGIDFQKMWMWCQHPWCGSFYCPKDAKVGEKQRTGRVKWRSWRRRHGQRGRGIMKQAPPRPPRCLHGQRGGRLLGDNYAPAARGRRASRIQLVVTQLTHHRSTRHKWAHNKAISCQRHSAQLKQCSTLKSYLPQTRNRGNAEIKATSQLVTQSSCQIVISSHG